MIWGGCKRVPTASMYSGEQGGELDSMTPHQVWQCMHQDGLGEYCWEGNTGNSDFCSEHLAQRFHTSAIGEKYWPDNWPVEAIQMIIRLQEKSEAANGMIEAQRNALRLVGADAHNLEILYRNYKETEANCDSGR